MISKDYESGIIVKSPGRINLIGEHTDYNDGFVLPAAINLSVDFYIQKREDSLVRLIAADLVESYDFDINDSLEPVQLAWANYLLGVLDQLKEENKFDCGFNLIFTSDIPIGSGLSSSAAIECGFGFAICEMCIILSTQILYIHSLCIFKYEYINTS